MKKIRSYFSLLILSLFSISCSQTGSTNQKTDTLFGENMGDWFVEGDGAWRLINNELVGKLDSGSGFVMAQNLYKNFELNLEFKPDSTINSGVFVRCRSKQISNTDCYEFNIWDLNPNQSYRTGAIVTRSKPLIRVETLDKWNKYRVKVENDHIQAWIDTVLVADIINNELIEGYIGLQAKGTGQIKFRNVKVRALNE